MANVLVFRALGSSWWSCRRSNDSLGTCHGRGSWLSQHSLIALYLSSIQTRSLAFPLCPLSLTECSRKLADFRKKYADFLCRIFCYKSSILFLYTLTLFYCGAFLVGVGFKPRMLRSRTDCRCEAPGISRWTTLQFTCCCRRKSWFPLYYIRFLRLQVFVVGYNISGYLIFWREILIPFILNSWLVFFNLYYW